MIKAQLEFDVPNDSGWQAVVTDWLKGMLMDKLEQKLLSITRQLETPTSDGQEHLKQIADDIAILKKALKTVRFIE